jgi:hypothetical protein
MKVSKTKELKIFSKENSNETVNAAVWYRDFGDFLYRSSICMDDLYYRLRY